MRIKAAVLVWGLALSAPAFAQSPGRRAGTDFHQVAEVQAPEELQAHQPYAIALHAQATAAHREGRESRLFDAAGVEVPSITHVARHRQQSVERQLTIFNTAWEPGLVQTLSLDQGTGKRDALNEFTFDIAELDYNVQAQVQGSDDGETWRIIRNNLHLIRHSRPGENLIYTHNRLRFPTSRFRYFRLVLASSGRNAPLTIRQVTARQTVDTQAAMLDVDVQPWRWKNTDDPDKRHEYWTLDLGQTHLGMSEVRLVIDGNDYARAVTVWEWNDDRDRLGRRLTHGMLYRYAGDSATTLRGFTTDARRLVVMLDQGDNTPVRLIGAVARRPRLEVRFLAPAASISPLRLHMTPDDARQPKYDLARLLAEREIEDFTSLSLGPVADNGAYAKPADPPPPVTERVPYLLYVLVIPLVAGLGWYIARMIKEGVPPEPPPAETDPPKL